MYHYTAIQWLFFFYFYCFFGWCFESAFVSVKKRKLVNRGFMRGPFLPLYGSGGIMMLVVSMPVHDNLFLVYLAGCAGATVLEYVTGVAMEALFKVRYWDYSNQKFNYRGYICLSSTLTWGFLTILMTEVVHKPVEQFAMGIPNIWLGRIVVILTVIMAADFALSFKTALDLGGVLVKVERAKEELLHMQKRLDVIIALADNDREERKQEKEYRLEELITGIGDKLGGLRKRGQEGGSEYLSGLKDELFELSTKYGALKERSNVRETAKNFYRRHMILGNPGMYSVKFKEVLEELRKAAEEPNHKE